LYKENLLIKNIHILNLPLEMFGLDFGKKATCNRKYAHPNNEQQFFYLPLKSEIYFNLKQSLSMPALQ